MMNKGLMKGLVKAGLLFLITFAVVISINYVLPVLAAALTSTNAQPLNLAAGANTTIDVNFTTAASIPADGKIFITLPSDFTIGGPAWCNLTGTFTSTISGNLTTIARSGGSPTNAVTPVWCTINNTINPRISGTTGNYMISTRNNAEEIIDNDNAVAADVITAGALTSTNAQPISLVAGANTTVDVNFTTANPLPADGKIVVTFGSGFTVSAMNTTKAAWCGSMDGTLNGSVSGQTFTLKRNADGTQQAAASDEWCTINLTINPRVSGSTGTYNITTKTTADAVIDTNASVAADTIVGGNLTSANVQPSSLVAGTNTSVDATFTTANSIPPDGKINVNFGSGFSVGGAASCNITGTFNTSISGQTLTVIRNANGGATFNVTPVTCTINNTINPTTTGSTGNYAINTTTAANVLVDTVSVGADTITQGFGGALTVTNVQPLSLKAGANTTIDVNFTIANALPANATINVSFSSGFFIGGAGTCNSMDGTFNSSIVGRYVILTRNSDGTEQAAGSAESCKINNTLVPNVTGSTGTYNITTLLSSTSLNNTIDEDTAVAADTIAAGNLTSVNVQPLNLTAGANTTVDVNFTVANLLPGSGRITVTFGTGYSLGGPGWCNTTGVQVFNTSITEQRVSIIWALRNITGGAFWCTINNTRIPQTSGSTGMYTVNTSTQGDVLIDTLDVAADIITANALQSPNVQPIILTAGTNNATDVNFSIINPIPSDGKIVVTFGTNFTVSSVVGTCNVLDGLFATSISGQAITLTRSTGTASAAGIAVNCTLNNTINPKVSGPAGTYNITTKTSADAVIDTDAAVAADTIVAANLTSVNVQPISLVAGVNTSVDANFTLANPWPLGGIVSITFGSGFSVGGPASCNVSGTFNTSISGQRLVITRNANGVEWNASAPVSCRINSTRNPQTTGSTGIYTVNTSTAVDILIDTLTVGADTITQGTGGTLTLENVQPISLVAGANTTVDVNFTTTNPIPADAIIKITFPSGFAVSAINTTKSAWCGSMDGTLNGSVSGQTFRLKRNADGTEQAAGSAEWCTLNLTINPRISGSTGTYSISTTDASQNTIDNVSNVAADTIVGGNLTSANVQPISLNAGINTSIDANFTTANSIPVDGKISVNFGSGFSVGGPASCNITGTFNTSISGQTLTVIRNANGGATFNVTPMSCRINNTVNPTTTGSTGNYAINTTTAANVLVDTLTVGADTIVQGYGGSLSSTNVQPISLVAGANTSVDVNFTTVNTIPVNATINVTFGGSFNLSGVNTTRAAWCGSIDGSFNVSVSGQTVTLTRNADGTEQAAASAEWCIINLTVNPRVSGSTGAYGIRTISSSILVDSDDSVTADTIAAGNLTSVNVQPINLATGANTTIDVNFTLANPWPAGGIVSVLFGGNFNVSGVPGASCNVSGTFNTTIALQRVIITRNANGVQWNASAPVSCRINNTINPLVTGSTGIYTVNTSTAADVLIDTLDVAADTITQGTGGALSSVNVQPLNLTAGTNGTVDVNFTTVNPIAANATINVTFPSGFLAGGPGTCNSMDGTFNTTISGQTVILTRNADGTAQAGNSAESCKINNTIVPNVTGSTGTYTIKTIISDILIDNATADADTITANSAVKLKIYVASSVLTNESATVTVWAQDTYGNNGTSSAWITLSVNGSATLDNYLKKLVSGTFTTVIQDSTAEIVTLNATEYTTGTETLNSTIERVTFTLADIVAPSITGTSPTAADSITSNSVAMYVNTTEAATCRFDNSDVSYAAMANTMTGASTTHNFTLSSLSNGAKTYFARCNDTAGNAMTASTPISFTVSLDVTAPSVIAAGPSGTIANSRPELLVNTSESATCKFDNSTKAYPNMTYTMTGTSTTHNFTLWTLLDNKHDFAVSCQDTAGNSMNNSAPISFTVDTRSNFNLTIPRGFGSNGYFTFRNNNNGWNSFQLVQNMDLNNTGLANYNVTNVLASVAGNYSKIYAYDGSTWKVYVPGTAGNTFTVFSSNATGENYYINMTVANERIEIN